jgi:hypothetical protein
MTHPGVGGAIGTGQHGLPYPVLHRREKQLPMTARLKTNREEKAMTACDRCGAELTPYPGRGRPRVRCEACATDKSALGKAWRAAHPRFVAARNLARRTSPQPKACAECGREFTPRRRDALLCSEQCRNARKARKRWDR